MIIEHKWQKVIFLSSYVFACFPRKYKQLWKLLISSWVKLRWTLLWGFSALSNYEDMKKYLVCTIWPLKANIINKITAVIIFVFRDQKLFSSGSHPDRSHHYLLWRLCDLQSVLYYEKCAYLLPWWCNQLCQGILQKCVLLPFSFTGSSTGCWLPRLL